MEQNRIRLIWNFVKFIVCQTGLMISTRLLNKGEECEHLYRYNKRV